MWRANWDQDDCREFKNWPKWNFAMNEKVWWGSWEMKELAEARDGTKWTLSHQEQTCYFKMLKENSWEHELKANLQLWMIARRNRLVRIMISAAFRRTEKEARERKHWDQWETKYLIHHTFKVQHENQSIAMPVR